MAAQKIGAARCPLCGGTASVSLSKNQLPVMTMNCCNAQLFARSDRSDMHIRALLIKPVDEPALVVPEAPPQIAPATEKSKPTWGIGIWG